MVLRRLLPLLVLCAAPLCVGSNEALLDLLVKKGLITEAEAAEVAGELDSGGGDSDAPSPAAGREKAAAGGDGGAAGPVARFSAKGAETVDVRFRGRLQLQYDALGMEDDGGDLPSANHFYFRRVFLGAEAELDSGFSAATVLDFAGDDGVDVAFDKAYIGYAPETGPELRFGYAKVPFGFEETTSSAKLPVIERSAANRFFADDIDFSARHTGVHADGSFGGGFAYGAALVNAAQGEGARLLGASNTSNDLAAFVRVRWAGNGLTVGADAGRQPNNAVTAGDVTAFTGYAQYAADGWNFLAEYFEADLDGVGDARGYAFRASRRFGKFEPVVRYSRLETDFFGVDTDELIRRAPEGGLVEGRDNRIDSVYAGLNYHYTPSVLFMAGYEAAEAESESSDESADVDGFRARMQLLW